MIRKQLYPLGKGNYPTLVQKNFNGAEPGLDVDLNSAFAQSFLLTFLFDDPWQGSSCHGKMAERCLPFRGSKSA